MLPEIEGYTPGPWTARHRHVDLTEYDDEQAGLGLEIDGPPEASNRGQFARAADARLIAAAPEIYETAKRYKEVLRYMVLSLPDDIDDGDKAGFFDEYRRMANEALGETDG